MHHPYLNLHFQVLLEVRQQRKKYGQRQLKDMWYGRDAVFG